MDFEQVDGKRVLLVGGDAKSQSRLEGYLTVHGYQVSCASSISEADRQLASTSFELIITEAELPDGKGEELTHCGLPVMALTLEQSGPTDPVSARFAVHLSKPVPLDSLLDAMKEMIEVSGDRHS